MSNEASSSAKPGDRSYLTSSIANVDTEYIVNALEGYGRNVARFRIAGSDERCQVAAYFFRPDDAPASEEQTAFSVACFSGSQLPDAENLRSFASFIDITDAELQRGVWLLWNVDRTEDVSLLFDATGQHGPDDADSRYYLNGLIIDPASSSSSSSSSDSSSSTDKIVFLGKAENPPDGAGSCGGVYIGSWDTDYHVPPFPTSPEGAPRLVGYHLNAGKSIRVRRRHYAKNERNPRGLPKMPAWHAFDPTVTRLDPHELQRVKDVFQHFDHDGNGHIDRKEMHRVAEHVYEILKDEKVTPEQIDRLFDKFDANQDQKLQLDEFQKIFLQIKDELIADGLLQRSPKHFQWRLSEQFDWVPAIRVAGQSADDDHDDEPDLVHYPTGQNGAWAFFDPQYYAYQPPASYALPVYPELPKKTKTKLKHVYHQVPVIVPTPPPPPPEDPRLYAFQVPPLAGAPYEMLFPEMHALRDLAKMKSDLPRGDYREVQAGFIKFLKLRLGMTMAQVTAASQARAYAAAQQAAAAQNAALQSAVMAETAAANHAAKKKDKRRNQQRAAVAHFYAQQQQQAYYDPSAAAASYYGYDPSAAYYGYDASAYQQQQQQYPSYDYSAYYQQYPYDQNAAAASYLPSATPAEPTAAEADVEDNADNGNTEPEASSSTD